MFSKKRTIVVYLLLIGGSVLLIETQTYGMWTARFGVPLSDFNTREWFNNETNTSYRYDYGAYNPSYYHYYTPNYDERTFSDDWYYDTYSREPDKNTWSESTAPLWNNYQGGYNNQNPGDDWYYDYYDNGDDDYYP